MGGTKLPLQFVRQLLISAAFTAEQFAQILFCVFGRAEDSNAEIKMSEAVILGIGKWLVAQQQVPVSMTCRILERLHGDFHTSIDEPTLNCPARLLVAISDAQAIRWMPDKPSYRLSDLTPVGTEEGYPVFSSLIDVLSLKWWMLHQYKLAQEKKDAAASGNEVPATEGTA